MEREGGDTDEWERERWRDWVQENGAGRKALRGFPAIVHIVYQMAFRAGRSFKEKGQVQTKQNKQESK